MYYKAGEIFNSFLSNKLKEANRNYEIEKKESFTDSDFFMYSNNKIKLDFYQNLYDQSFTSINEIIHYLKEYNFSVIPKIDDHNKRMTLRKVIKDLAKATSLSLH